MSRRGGSGCRCPAQIATGTGRAAHLVPVRAAGAARDRRRRRARRRQGDARGRSARDRARASFGTRRHAKVRRAARGLHPRAGVHDDGRRAARSHQLHADLARRAPAIASTSARDRVRPAAARAARRAERPSAAAGPGPGGSRALRAARNADARPPALGGPGRRADDLSRRRPNSRSWGSSRRTPFRGRPGSPAGSRPRATAARSGSPARNATLDLPRILPRPIAFDTLAERREMGAPRRHDEGAARAARNRQRRRRRATRREPTARSRAGPAKSTSSRTRRAATPGRSTAICRESIDDATRDWLAHGARRRHARSTRASRSPATSPTFRSPNGKGGKLTFTTKAKAVTLAYADGLAGDRCHRRRRADRRNATDGRRRAGARAQRGNRQDARRDSRPRAPITRCCGSTAKRRARSRGSCASSTRVPVAARIGQITRDVEASGGGRLALKIELPLGRPEDIKVAGEFALCRRAVAHRRRAGARQGQRQARRSPSTTSARATSPRRSWADRRSSRSPAPAGRRA